MTEKQLSLGDDEIVQLLNRVYQHFKEGQFEEAIPLLEKAISVDFEYPGIASALKCATFWRERQASLRAMPDGERAGEYVFEQWRQFTRFLSKLPDANERCVFTIRSYIFGVALQRYLALYEGSLRTDAQILLRIGRCYKSVGNYESAIEYLELANQQKRSSAAITAELADCYSLINETRAAKVFFREAFFLGASEIDLAFMESPMLQRLAGKLREMGIPEPELLEWIPVYGTLFGVFNVKRELRPLEFGKLKQSIYTLEREIETGRRDAKALVPRLLNRYFWLIDHMQSSGEDRSRIDEVLEKVRKVHVAVYEEYVK